MTFLIQLKFRFFLAVFFRVFIDLIVHILMKNLIILPFILSRMIFFTYEKKNAASNW